MPKSLPIENEVVYDQERNDYSEQRLGHNLRENERPAGVPLNLPAYQPRVKGGVLQITANQVINTNQNNRHQNQSSPSH